MTLRYSYLSPIRLLLLLSVACFSVPIVFQDHLEIYITLPFFYFTGAYCFFLNFPSISEFLHSRPYYVDEMITDQHSESKAFRRWYNGIMNFMLAFIFSGMAEYIIFKDIQEKPVMEIIGIVGGNISLYMKVQNTIGKVVLWAFDRMKRKHRESIELQTPKNKKDSSFTPPAQISH